MRQAFETGLSLPSWQKDTFAYADSYDEENSRYRGLRAGSPATISLDGSGLLVKPDVAQIQFEKDREEAEKAKTDISGKPVAPYDGSSETGSKTLAGDPDIRNTKKSRFYGDVLTDATRFFRSTDDIEKEILKHLNAIPGTTVKITIHIEATSKDGFSQDTERTLRENGRTLGFGNVEFE